MLHEARGRQKFVSDVQYLQDIQHKVDSEYQACLRRQGFKRNTNEKEQEQLGGQATSLERSRYSSGTSSKQSSHEEDLLVEPRSSTENPTCKRNSRLPAINQKSVKQKDKSTMTARSAEKAAPSNAPPAQATQSLSRKRRPHLGRMTVIPEMQSPRASRDGSRQKLQLPVKVPVLRGADSVAQQEGPKRTSDTKPKRLTRERRNVLPFSQKMKTKIKITPERSRGAPPPGPPPCCQGTGCPQRPGGSPGTTGTTEPRKVPFGFRDEDFYSVLSLNAGAAADDDDTEEETRLEEERLLVGMRPARCPLSQTCRLLGAPATLAKRKACEDSPANRGAGAPWSASCPHSAKASRAAEPPGRQKTPRGPEPPRRGPAADKDSVDGESDRSDASVDEDINAEDGSSGGYTPMEDRPGARDHQRDWRAYLSSSSRSLDYFLSARPAAPRAATHASYNAHGPVVFPPLSDEVPVDPSPSSASTYSSDSEGSLRLNIRQPLSPIRSRGLAACTEQHSCSQANDAHEADVRRGDSGAASQSPAAPSYTHRLLLDPENSLSSGPSLPTVNLQGHLHMSGSLQENIPSFTFFAVSDFPGQNSGSRVSISAFIDEKEATKRKADPEKLKKLQESLLEEDSEEEENLCRICQIAGGSPANPLLEPCGCVGSLQFVHQECLKKWLKVKITSGADLSAVKTCEMCKKGLLVNLKDFNLTEFYQKHQQSRAQNELVNSGLYLVLLLHLYEQRFAELMRLNNHRVARVRLSRNHPQPRPEDNENSELGEEN
ncbi:probable E3 ubiquitin-protein ligase MARCHF10 isoform X2 [Erinaceus europaeus]|uniref:RING-type E3 ubiquitin transferase n=1 Tax=Erinaceus europaeus TaxID=9365 RepID=A0ABM3YBQ3_ERIEU|nr:probable E3 ubiquitin-protein ligase MARCHF10 isoform X2 [Erinaceus europaeus]